MWRMRVVHATGYAYKGPVTASYNEARLTPRSDSRQNVIINRVETVPATRSYRYVDYWGTAVTAFDLHAPHTELEVTSSSVVETEKPEPPTTRIGWADLRSAAVADRFDEVLAPTPYTPPSKRLDRVARHLAKGCDPQDAVIAAVEWVRNELRYVPGTTEVHSSGLDALREGEGVCQDFAHLSLILLRSMGIPARYVSGYLHPKSEAEIGEAVEGESHAWVQVWTGSWWDIDPTNRSDQTNRSDPAQETHINEQYISVGRGRSYADVSPLKGIYLGRGSSDLDVVVEMTRLA
ncbi:MAG TPA: transglutaminase family protein [Mycobacterium sp.]|nr:transglutaminase family protein [Mycobacterium sp.]HPZ93955.1 transglutaminase family protein [Mycobacterium sp.]HQE15818.1 transglutaminase family protein [Mycobacterium sp.]